MSSSGFTPPSGDPFTSEDPNSVFSWNVGRIGVMPIHFSTSFPQISSLLGSFTPMPSGSSPSSALPSAFVPIPQPLPSPSPAGTEPSQPVASPRKRRRPKKEAVESSSESSASDSESKQEQEKIRKEKKRISNREAARKSRQRKITLEKEKNERLIRLENENRNLTAEIQRLRAQLQQVSESAVSVETDSSVSRFLNYQTGQTSLGISSTMHGAARGREINTTQEQQLGLTHNIATLHKAK